MPRNAGRVQATPQEGDTPPKAELNFITPCEFVELPSQGRFYPADHPLHNQETVEIKHMTAKEEDILTSQSLIKKGLVFERLLDSVILTKGVNVSELLSGDRTAIIIEARKSGYGDVYKTSTVCPVCAAHNEQEHDLNNTRMNDWESYCDDNGIAVEEGLFKFSLPATGYEVAIKPLIGVHELKIAKTKESTLITEMNQYVASINGETDRNVLRKAIESLPARDAKFIRRHVKLMLPNISLKHEFECTSCGFDTEMEVKINPDFFWFE